MIETIFYLMNSLLYKFLQTMQFEMWLNLNVTSIYWWQTEALKMNFSIYMFVILHK